MIAGRKREITIEYRDCQLDGLCSDLCALMAHYGTGSDGQEAIRRTIRDRADAIRQERFS